MASWDEEENLNFCRVNKNLILCFDGTSENFGAQPFTNVLKIYQMLDNRDEKVQMCYYQPGIGTSADFDYVVDIRRRLTLSYFQNSLDSMFAFGLDKNIISAYLFLVKYYEVGDRIYMFGFSRGAFIARVLAGMLERVGLLNRGLEDMIGMAWRIYQCWEYAEQPTESNYTTTLIEEFRKAFCRNHEIRVYFQGLFDSVNSVGILRDRLFPCTQRSDIVNHVRHAVSINERRGKFKQQCFAPNPYFPKFLSLENKSYITDFDFNDDYSNSKRNKIPYSESLDFFCSTTEESLLKSSCMIPEPIMEEPKRSNSDLLIRITTFLDSYGKNIPKVKTTTNTTKSQVEGVFQFIPTGKSGTSNTSMSADLVEKWFLGDHSDVGGGWSIDSETLEAVSNLPLRWMLAEAVNHGLKFKPRAIHDFAKKSTSVGALFATTHDCLSFTGASRLANSCNGNEITIINHLNQTPVTLGIKNKIKMDEEQKKNVTLSKQEVIKNMYSSQCGRINKLMVALWWSLEWIPIGLRKENKEGKWRNIYVPNFGRRRYIPPYGDIHWSVYWRIRFDNLYRPPNLPDYAKQLVKEFEGIDLKHNAAKQNYTRASEQKSYPATALYNSVKQGTNDTDDQDSEYCQLLNKMINDGMINILYRKTRNRFLKWSENCWQDVPDDLKVTLDTYPDI